MDKIVQVKKVVHVKTYPGHTTEDVLAYAEEAAQEILAESRRLNVPVGTVIEIIVRMEIKDGN